MSSINIWIKRMQGEPIQIQLSPDFTLYEFNNAIEHRWGSMDGHTLLIKGKQFRLQDQGRFNQIKHLITNGSTIAVARRATGGCFLSDTKVLLSDGKNKRIDEIQINDRLISFTSTGEIVTTTVEQVFVHDVDEYIELCAGDISLCVTSEHPFFIGNNTFCSIGKLNINDCIYRLVDQKLESITITSMKTVHSSGIQVYNLHTTEPHTYFANGIGVHNKFGAEFVDLANTEGLQRLEWTETAPDWREASPGLCLEGTCTNSACQANQELVIVNVKFGKFDLVVDAAERSKCPACGRYVDPITCAFNRCKWRWQGIKQTRSGEQPEKVSADWSIADNAYHRFDQDMSGTVNWRQLIIETIQN